MANERRISRVWGGWVDFQIQHCLLFVSFGIVDTVILS